MHFNALLQLAQLAQPPLLLAGMHCKTWWHCTKCLRWNAAWHCNPILQSSIHSNAIIIQLKLCSLRFFELLYFHIYQVSPAPCTWNCASLNHVAEQYENNSKCRKQETAKLLLISCIALQKSASIANIRKRLRALKTGLTIWQVDILCPQWN